MNKDREKRELRKNEHVQLAQLPESVIPVSHFDELIFVHHSIPETNYDDANIKTLFSNIQLESPIYINAMTGGSKMTGEINASLAEIARELGIAMAVGSQHSGLSDDSLSNTYRIVRKHHPTGVIFANIGADAPLDYAKRAVSMLEANALQIHVNAPQEMVMPEGDRNFTGWLKKIEKIVQMLEIPVIIKEVGFGMSSETLSLLTNIGVQFVDVSGRGGTNFIRIENQRRQKQEYEYLKGWGQSTVVSLLEAQTFSDQLTLFASGGIRNPLDIVKCLALGATFTGLSGPVLRMLLKNGVQKTIDELTNWNAQIKSILTILGVSQVSDLTRCPLVITGEVRDWCEARGIDISPFARRRRL